MISKILVPTDGSKAAMKSVEYAAGFARQTGASITLLSVIDKSSFVPQSIPSLSTSKKLIEPIEDYLRIASETFIEEAEKICLKHAVPSKKVIRTGHPVDEIVKEAEKSKVDIITMPISMRSSSKSAKWSLKESD